MTLAEATKTIMSYCNGIERNCEKCVFARFYEYEHWITCQFGTMPCFWKIPIETNAYDKVEEHKNCTVQILTNSITGETSIGWWENEEE